MPRTFTISSSPALSRSALETSAWLLQVLAVAEVLVPELQRAVGGVTRTKIFTNFSIFTPKELLPSQ
jgi:hypothetical protein